MHLAIVIESGYRENSQLPELPGAHASAELVSSTLTQAGFRVERVPATRELASYLDERLLGTATPLQSLFVYYTGYVALNPERGPALLLDGPRLRAFPLSRLGRSIMSAAYSGAFVIDAVAVPEPDQSPKAIADSVLDVMPRGGRVSTFVAAREQRDTRAWMPSRFADLFVVALDWLEATGADPATVTLRSILNVMREERVSYSLIGATAERLAGDDFTLLPARVVERPSGPVRRVAREAAPESEAMTSWAPRAERVPLPSAPLPSFDEPLPSFEEPLPAFPQPKPVPFDRADQLAFDREEQAAFDREEAAPEEAPEAAPERELEAAAEEPADDRDELPRMQAAFDDAPQAPFDDPALSSAPLEDDEAEIERSSVLPSPAARREMASRPQVRDLDTLVALIAVYDRDEEHAEAVAMRQELASLLSAEPPRRAFVLEEAARIAANRLGDRVAAVRLAREALEVDPTSLGALDVVTSELSESQDWAELAEVYERVLLRLADGPIAARVASHLGVIRETRLEDADGAIRAYERALSCDPSDASVHRKLAEIHEACGDTLSAIERRRDEARVAPTSASVYSASLALFSRAGDIDAAWNAASALVALEAADDNTRAIYESYRDPGLLQVQRGLAAGDWTSGLLDPDMDRDLTELFRVVEAGATRVRLEQLQRARALPALPDSARHDPEKSTAMLARSLLWTSKLLGVETPQLYVLDGVPGHMASAPALLRTSMVSRTLASGLALGELSFLWARHLTFQRSEHHLLAFYPTAKDLTNLVIAAKALGAPETRSVDFLETEAKEIARGLRRTLDDSAREKLVHCARALSPEGLPERAAAWARSVEAVAGRVGLLACGDIAVAAGLVSRFPLSGALSLRDQSDDLLAYSISAEYGELRGRLGAQVRSHARRAG